MSPSPPGNSYQIQAEPPPLRGNLYFSIALWAMAEATPSPQISDLG
jgi:hypothetical protein